MKLYVAAKWEDRSRAREVMGYLIAAGHTISYDWTNCDQFTMLQAALDKQGVMTADALVFVAEKEFKYQGALVEFGIAVARGIPIYVMGEGIDHCIFTQLPEVNYGIERLLSPLRGIPIPRVFSLP